MVKWAARHIGIPPAFQGHISTDHIHNIIAAPKDVQELLGHSDVSTTMNIYAHSTRKAKRDSSRLLDKVASNA